MKNSNSKTKSKQPPSDVQTTQLRVDIAETVWHAAKEQEQVSKQRRKEARLNFRQAKRQAKLAKADLAVARKVFTSAKAKLGKSGGPVSALKSAKARRPGGTKVRSGNTGGNALPVPKRRPGSVVRVKPTPLPIPT